MLVTGDTIIQMGAILGALLTIGGVIVAIIKFIVKMRADEKETAESLRLLQKKQDEDIKAVNNELAIINYGVLSCLRGLQEQGCDGPVKEAINNIENYINQKAHT